MNNTCDHCGKVVSNKDQEVCLYCDSLLRERESKQETTIRDINRDIVRHWVWNLCAKLCSKDKKSLRIVDEIDELLKLLGVEE